MKHVQLFQIHRSIQFRMKFFYIYFDIYLCLIFVEFLLFADHSKWLPIKMKYGNINLIVIQLFILYFRNNELQSLFLSSDSEITFEILSTNVYRMDESETIESDSIETKLGHTC